MKTKTVEMTVRFNVTVPADQLKGNDVDKLLLDLDVKNLTVLEDIGRPITGAVINEYETILAEELNKPEEDDDA